MKFNHEIFFEGFRTFYKSKAGKNLSTTVVKAVDFLLDEVSKNTKWDNCKQVAYAFATIMHETANTFKPIKEYRAKSGDRGRANQDRYWLTGFYGRGFVQLTWDYNYKKASKKLGVDLLSSPDLALDPHIAFEVLTYGMHEGWFTGKKLSDYINNSKTDYPNARRIINGVDKASLIAGYAKAFEQILKDALEDSHTVPLIKRTADVQATNGEELPDNLGAEDLNNQNYEEEDVKSGEPVPEQSAKAGEPVVGGRPEDEPIEIKQTLAEKATGLGAWASNIKAQLVSLGIGGFSLGSFAFLTNPTFLWIAGGLIVVAAIASATFFLTTLYVKSKEKREKEDRALQITLKEMEIRADPSKYNVKVV